MIFPNATIEEEIGRVNGLLRRVPGLVKRIKSSAENPEIGEVCENLYQQNTPKTVIFYCGESGKLVEISRGRPQKLRKCGSPDCNYACISYPS